MILDTLSRNLGSRVKQAIEARGCRLLFLPASSPDFSPIEEAFSKLKTCLRRVGARTREDLQETIAAALDLITAAAMLSVGFLIVAIHLLAQQKRLHTYEQRSSGTLLTRNSPSGDG